MRGSAPGPIPDGPFDGEIVFPRGSSGKLRAAEIIGGLKGLGVNFKGKMLETAGEALWKGKVFYRDQKVLRNRIQDLAVLRPVIGPGDIPKIDVDGRDAWLLFPAKLYCGQSLIDSRRESIIIDYAFTDEIRGYREKPDFLAGRRGLKVRDEIRMVRPGLYLGRAYMDHAFILNFVLNNKDVDKAGRAEFETGQITRRLLARHAEAGAGDALSAMRPGWLTLMFAAALNVSIPAHARGRPAAGRALALRPADRPRAGAVSVFPAAAHDQPPDADRRRWPAALEGHADPARPFAATRRRRAGFFPLSARGRRRRRRPASRAFRP